MTVLLIEKDESVVELLAAAIQLARPGTQVTVVRDIADARRPAESAIAVLGPHVAATASRARLGELRQRLPGMPIVAMPVADTLDDAEHLDAIYELPVENWKDVAGTVRRLLADWVKQ